MTKLRMVVSESLRSLTANLSTTVAATMTVLIAMVVLGLVVALGTWMLSWSDYAKDKLEVKVFLCTNLSCPQGEVTEPQIERTRRALLSLEGVERVEFVSKEEALEIMKKRTPELVRDLTTNPLPHAFEVTPRDAEQVLTLAGEIRGLKLAGVEKVRDGEKVADTILKVARVVSAIVGVAVVILVIASTFLIANTIRLSIFARRREIEVMKLVGASNWFVRGPFMIEGLLCGLAGSLVAVVLLLAGKVALSSWFDRYAESNVEAINFAWNAAILLVVGLVLGVAGSGLTLRRFLRV